MSSLSTLRDLGTGDAAYALATAELRPLQLQAVSELLAEYREHVAILDRRASGCAIGEIRSLQDVVPLLLSHTTYKSYPDVYVHAGRWADLNRWLSALSRYPVDLEAGAKARDVDEWLAELYKRDHRVIATSGATGKCSFLNSSPVDSAIFADCIPAAREWSAGEAIGPRPTFVFGPSEGRGRFVEGYRAIARAFGLADETFFLSQRPVSVAEINDLGALRKAMADGTVRPDDIARVESAARTRQAETRREFELMVRRVEACRDRPIVVNGGWSRVHQFTRIAGELGVRSGGFDPATVVIAGGGTKGTVLPPDYKEQIAEFFAPARVISSYGMSEWNASWPQCAAGRYHCPPTTLALTLDEAGEQPVEADDDGVMRGRLGFVDLLVDGRWGGLITGDHVCLHTTPCPCGRGLGMTASEIRRVSAADDDKLTCAGTIEGYLRGMLTFEPADS